MIYEKMQILQIAHEQNTIKQCVREIIRNGLGDKEEESVVFPDFGDNDHRWNDRLQRTVNYRCMRQKPPKKTKTERFQLISPYGMNHD